MRDLVVITADADMEAVMRAVLKRPQALGIRDIAFEVRRHDGRDAGVFQNGPEVTRTLKSDFDRLLMLWDHHGRAAQFSFCNFCGHQVVGVYEETMLR